MKRSICLFFLLLANQFLLQANPKRVLFIGNSYTYVNDLPGTFKDIALSLGDTVYTSSVAPGGFTFNQHSAYAATLDSIRLGNWDYIILQEQSQIPAFSPAQVQTDCVPYAKKLCDTIKAYNSCAEIVFYMTWGRKNGDASNCANYPPICTYAGMQQGLYDSYLMLSDSNNATCSPVGAVWRVLRNIQPTIELYSPDESHPSVTGTYLAACTFYSSLFRKPVINSQYSPGAVTTSDGFYIRQTVDAVVFDSLETWQQYGHLPKARFTKTINGAAVNFSNTSLRASQYTWNFGDGAAPNTSTSPSHTYTTSGTYIVSLTAVGQTCQSSIITDTLQIQVPSAISTINGVSNMPSVSSSKERLHISFPEAGIFSLFSIQGQMLKQLDISNKSSEQLDILKGGVYFWQWQNHRGKFSGKVWVP